MSDQSLPQTKSIRACDNCAARKSRCNGEMPCQRCKALSLRCTTLRRARKPGPKAPWGEKRRRARLSVLGQNNHDPSHISTEKRRDASGFKVPIATLITYLRVYQTELYAVWPVVNIDQLIKDLEAGDDPETYVLATALSAVTISQLNLPTQDGTDSQFDRHALAREAKRTRTLECDLDHPTLNTILGAFFLHVFLANIGNICQATVLLREAITIAQFQGLDDSKHYTSLSPKEKQLHLRVFWILYITERGHTTRFELPRLLSLDLSLPQLEVEDNEPHSLRGFRSLCKIVEIFSRAMDTPQDERTPEFFLSTDADLRAEAQQSSYLSHELQKADISITVQWMRLVLWKMAMFSVVLSAEPRSCLDDNLSISFPQETARRITSYLGVFSRSAIEAHGIGMRMKLTEVAISLADLLLCGPVPGKYQTMDVSPSVMLESMSRFLLSLPSAGNTRLAILQDKISKCAIAEIPRSLSSDSIDIELSRNSDRPEIEHQR